MKRYKLSDFFNKKEEINYYQSPTENIWKLYYNKEKGVYVLDLFSPMRNGWKNYCYSKLDTFILSNILQMDLKKITQAEAFIALI
jgi:hypothetical protein